MANNNQGVRVQLNVGQTSENGTNLGLFKHQIAFIWARRHNIYGKFILKSLEIVSFVANLTHFRLKSDFPSHNQDSEQGLSCLCFISENRVTERFDFRFLRDHQAAWPMDLYNKIDSVCRDTWPELDISVSLYSLINTHGKSPRSDVEMSKN